jgi:hypothetical protein
VIVAGHLLLSGTPPHEHPRLARRSAGSADHAQPAEALNALTYDMVLASRRRSTNGVTTTRSCV